MAIQSLPSTTNFNLAYDDSNTFAKGMAQAIAGVCETEFAALAGWFAITTGFGPGDRISLTVQAIASGGANNFGYQSGGNSTINVNFLGGYSAAQTVEVAKMMFVNELVEVFMSFNSQKGPATWNAGNSDGEGLSQYLGILRFPTGHYLAYSSWSDKWLSTARADFVSGPEGTDGNAVSFGCALLFLLYLDTQLGFTPAQIVQAGSTSLAGLYTNLTGDARNPFGYFLTLVTTKFPGTATIGGGSGRPQDDPFPIFSLAFWDNQNTFGKADVVNALALNRSFNDALLLVLEGFSPAKWQALGSPVPADPFGDARNFPGITFDRTHVEFEAALSPKAPQRIHFHYDVGFGTASPPAFTTAPQSRDLHSKITIAGQTPPDALTELFFFGAEDPYFSNINPKVDNVPWLSEDLRVFATAGSGAPVPGGPNFATDTLDGARTYLASLLTYLNNSFGDPSLTDPFDAANNIIPQQTDALSGDSSVVPNLNFLGLHENIYNFAIARVRLGGSVGVVSKPVKVFFRMWQTQSPDTDYDPGSRYNSKTDALGLPGSPLPDGDNTTFPFYATATADAATPNIAEYGAGGAGGVNAQPITINHGGGQWTYFGCLLNVYDDSYKVNGTPVTQLLPGTHHCLVAQIAYDDAPIIVPPGQTVSPGNTDKLAQRNLQISAAFNPGKPPTNRVPQTFDLRPTAITAEPLDFDELMIDWGLTPAGSIASIYWPSASAAQVIALANTRYGHHDLMASDAHTIQTTVHPGLSYVPVPPQTGKNLASLLTVALPGTVKKGQTFKIVVRRVTSYSQSPVQVPRSPAAQHHSPAAQSSSPPAAPQPPAKPPVSVGPPTRKWRYITGAFEINLQVETEKEILPYDANTLAIFKWRLKMMPHTDRWYPILLRYIGLLSDRINGLGGNAGEIAPSSTGLPTRYKLPHGHDHDHDRDDKDDHDNREHRRHEDIDRYTGKVVEIIYDCFGDFQGFVLGCCDGDRLFRSHENGIEIIVRRALRDADRLEAFYDEDSGRLIKIVLKR